MAPGQGEGFEGACGAEDERCGGGEYGAQLAARMQEGPPRLSKHSCLGCCVNTAHPFSFIHSSHPPSPTRSFLVAREEAHPFQRAAAVGSWCRRARGLVFADAHRRRWAHALRNLASRNEIVNETSKTILVGG